MKRAAYECSQKCRLTEEACASMLPFDCFGSPLLDMSPYRDFCVRGCWFCTTVRSFTKSVRVTRLKDSPILLNLRNSRLVTSRVLATDKANPESVVGSEAFLN